LSTSIKKNRQKKHLPTSISFISFFYLRIKKIVAEFFPEIKKNFAQISTGGKGKGARGPTGYPHLVRIGAGGS
jgi:hypothetical protein